MHDHRAQSFLAPSISPYDYMQQVPTDSSNNAQQPTPPLAPTTSTQDGYHEHEPSLLSRAHAERSRSQSPRSVSGHGRGAESPIELGAGLLEERLYRLSIGSHSGDSHLAPGQRILEYENALTPPVVRQAMGFKVIKRRSSQVDGPRLEDFPNEVLTHILSHLHPDSHAAVALVSKRFYALVTTPHAWRIAFLRFFPAHTSLRLKSSKTADDMWSQSASDTFRSETRFFSRLTVLATWRSEYLFRTRLLRSLERGKPGTKAGHIGSPLRNSQSGKKLSAVLTYNSKLPWVVTNIHAVFSNGKKPPRAVQGTSDLGACSISDPTTGKIEKWGFDDDATFAQVDEVFPDLVPFGLGEGPASCPNVMDVSQPYGYIAGEGYPGGRAFFRLTNEMRGRYLNASAGVADTYPDIPKIPEMSEGISSVWIAKSSAVPAATQGVIGMLTGSTVGVVTAYALGWDLSGHRHSNGDITARWILSPGVPIISLKVDENYGVKRKSTGRVWAVAMNALGEVFYMTAVPRSNHDRSKGDDAVRQAWLTGRSVYWHLVEGTRRIARSDELDRNTLRGAYTPRSPADSMKLTKDQMAAEAREIEKFLLYKPSHFRKACEGWDMQRRLEVDFANDDGKGTGEGIFVIECGLAEGRSPSVRRFMRTKATVSGTITAASSGGATPLPSVFGCFPTGEPLATPSLEPQAPLSPPSTPIPEHLVPSALQHDWCEQQLGLRGHGAATISASAIDNSSQAVLTLSEDPLHVAGEVTDQTASQSKAHAAEIPGRRARFICIGTRSGTVLVWNARESLRTAEIQPVRVIQTDSPEISCLGVTSLYLVHGGSDGLVQAWDPLASTLDPIRTVNARSNGRVPRHMLTMNPALAQGNYSAAGAIFLDPNPTVLRGVVSFGAFMRYWAYSSAGHPTGRRRRVRHSDIHGRLASRRQGDTSSRYIAAEEAELRHENEQNAREQARLRNRFGVGALGDLTEEEAIRYAQMVSEEAYLVEEQRRASDSAADASLDTASSWSEATTDTITPEPSVVDSAQSVAGANEEEDDYEQQIQQAIRLSLMEGVNDVGQSPLGNSSGDYEFSVKFKPKGGSKDFKGARSAPSSGSPSAVHTPMTVAQAGPSTQAASQDEDLALAISLSLQEQEQATQRAESAYMESEDFPPLENDGKSRAKGKGVTRW